MEIYIDEIEQIKDINFAFAKDYEFTSTIAKGSFGIVKSAINKKTNQKVAVKIIEKKSTSSTHLNKLKQEVTILKQLQHPNIIQYITSMETFSKLYIITELISGGTLQTYIDSLLKTKQVIPQDKIREIIYHLLKAVHYIHKKDICHHDIKPENIMFVNNDDVNSLKLVDFGLSCNSSENRGYCGTFLYMAPETFDKRTLCDSKPVDIWSIGIITALMLNGGVHPYYNKGDNEIEYAKKIKEPFKDIKGVNKITNNFLQKILEPNVNYRYSAENALGHPWLTQNIYGEIPLTIFQKLHKEILISKLKDVFVVGLMLTYFKERLCDKKSKENKFNMKLYVECIKEEICKQGERIRKRKEEMFGIVSSNTTNNNGNVLSPKKDNNNNEKINEYQKEKTKTITVRKKSSKRFIIKKQLTTYQTPITKQLHIISHQQNTNIKISKQLMKTLKKNKTSSPNPLKLITPRKQSEKNLIKQKHSSLSLTKQLDIETNIYSLNYKSQHKTFTNIPSQTQPHSPLNQSKGHDISITPPKQQRNIKESCKQKHNSIITINNSNCLNYFNSPLTNKMKHRKYLNFFPFLCLNSNNCSKNNIKMINMSPQSCKLTIRSVVLPKIKDE